MSYSNGPKIITDGLVFCIDPASQKNSATTLKDLGSQNCDGTLTNGAAFSNNYISLDGTDDYINFASNNIINNILTVDIWFYIGNTNNNLIICAGDNTYNSSSWNWGLFACCSAGAANTLLGRADAGGGGLNLGNISSVYLNQWNNITMTRSNGNFYKNGTYFNTSTVSVLSDKPLRLGGVPGAYTNGRIGTVRIYNKTLTANEILINYNATKSRYGL